MSDNVITTIISASAIVSGSLIGAIFSYYISKKTTSKSIKEQYRIQEANREYEEKYKIKEKCTYANVVRLDICTAIFQSIRSLQNKENISYLYILPISKEYQKAVASLSDKYSLKELSYIYQLYGIIEKVNKDIYNWTYDNVEGYKMIKRGFLDILKKLYGENYKKILKIEIDKLSYEDLYNNDLIKEGYKEVLMTLDNLCYAENLIKEKEEQSSK
ncbi:hypothetical protein [Clostridium chauvoei]|uniref:Uncharacterized protein n=3 Tax=Clostridium chauvoei TaxID=46867 RepID=S6EKR2_9CLOT|nr:hypothetical protein [Clostridium chauvoei]ATD55156.1 hypothetical protein BTM20_07840 [Clostridium chauvoei]ATD57171.1 hypothetical protein BTM21_05210 [Clostridium chauvoei]MBX7279495.1 hypothetical protein [Clostridium chauvoei]MBX7281864.1 hypothetical protein [Clostridium chauvoei]MBX7284547.1 hypothetical protein [Clostridium chauvoei]